MNLKNTLLALLAMSSSLWGQTITTNTNSLTVPWSTSFSGFQGITNASKAFRVTASNLTTNIAVALSDSTNWQVSTNNTAFTNTLSMASNSSNALLWVRMSGSNVGTFTNIISLTSTGTNGTNTNNVTNITTITGTVVASLASVMYDKTTALIVRPTNLADAIYGTNQRPLLFNITSGQVSYTNTNPLTFTNRVYQSSTNATNVPELRLISKNTNVASWFIYDADQTPPFTTNNANWHVQFIGLNHVPSGSGFDRAKYNQSIGAASFTIENMYYSSEILGGGHFAEIYFNVEDYGTNAKGTTRAMSIVGSQTDSTIGSVDFAYPATINYQTNAFLEFGLTVNSTNGGNLGRLKYNGTNANQFVLLRMQVQDAATDFYAYKNELVIRNYEAGRNALRLNSNGVVLGATDANLNPAAPVHLAGNTRIDGAITFNNTTNAATTRTNLGLGNGITTNVTFVDAATNTNTVSISNGIITGWTQEP